MVFKLRNKYGKKPISRRRQKNRKGKQKMNDENKSKTAEEEIVAEHRELKEISNNKDEWLRTFLKAFKTLDVTIAHNGGIYALNSMCFKKDDGLNQKEKEFLESVLRPYTDSYDITIKKKMGDENQYYLDIILFPHWGSDSRVERFCLPLSGIDKELMFSNLKKNYQYTTDDLNLFCK
jgi:hypothetical protein